MLTFFDYVFYKACKFYDRGKPENAGIPGLSILVLLQVCNLLSILFLISIVIENRNILSKLLVISICVFLFIANGVRYNKHPYETLKERWDSEQEDKRTKRQLFVLFYIIISVVSFIGLAIWLGGKNR